MVRSFFLWLARLFAPPQSRRGLNTSAASAAPSQPPKPHLAEVQTLLSQVTGLTATVAKDVGDHSTTIQAISSELTAVAQSDPTAVAAIVCKLLVANQDLQGRLQRAEESLKDNSQQLTAAVTAARTDGLTGLINRRALDEELKRSLADFQQQGRPATLFMLDVDQFKKFNDTFGHLAGDHVLAFTARLLHSQSLPTDMVARFGGEEFAILFKGATAASVRERAERLRQQIGKRMVGFGDRKLHVTASGGLSELAAGDTIADWVARADRALYTAKGGGRDCAFEVRGDKLERIMLVGPPATSLGKSPVPVNQAQTARPAAEASAALAVEGFADTSFVPTIARRIAEWRRGGTTLTVMLARLDDPVASAKETDDSQSPIRVALQVARLCIREMDLITRWQPDGLGFLLPGTSVTDAKTVARRLRAALAANNTDGARPRLSISIGLAEGIEGNDAKRVLERAWLALEAARTAGSGNIYIHDGLKSVGLKLAAVIR
jgi:diguanylate cyclase (GGDEF)-like protein